MIIDFDEDCLGNLNLFQEISVKNGKKKMGSWEIIGQGDIFGEKLRLAY